MDGQGWSDVDMDTSHNSFDHLRVFVLYILEATTVKTENAAKGCGEWRYEHADNVNRR